MTLSEQYIHRVDTLVDSIPTLTTNIIVEGEKGLTYYELRSFLTVLLKQVKNQESKKLVDDLLKTVSRLEIMRVPVPVVKKQKSVSPTVF